MNLSLETIIASCALVLTLYEMWATRHHNRLSVTPHLVGSNNTNWTDEGLTFCYTLSNQGIGPAKIKKITLFLNNEPFPTSKRNPVEALITAKIAGRIRHVVRQQSFPGMDYTLISGQIYQMLELFIPNAKMTEEEQISEVLKGIGLRVEYESFYREKFVYDTRKIKTDNTPACPKDIKP